MKMTLDLKPAAARIVRTVSRVNKITLDEAASELILKSIVPPSRIAMRHGIPLARNDGIRMTSGEIAAALNEA